MSDLIGILDCLSDTVIEVGESRLFSVSAVAVSDTPNLVVSGRLPLRLVLPPGVLGAGAQNFRYETRKLMVIRWNIVDLFLFESVRLGEEIGLKYELLTKYVSAYTAQVAAIRTPTTSSFIAGLSPTIGIFEYPRGSGYFYNGVQFTIAVDERICL